MSLSSGKTEGTTPRGGIFQCIVTEDTDLTKKSILIKFHNIKVAVNR